MTRYGLQDCGNGELQKTTNGKDFKGIDTGELSTQNEHKKRSRNMDDLRTARVIPAQKGTAKRIQRRAGDEVSMDDMERRKRSKELTGSEIRKMILEKEESRDIKKAKREAIRMVKKGNVKSIDSYFKYFCYSWVVVCLLITESVYLW